MSVWLSGCGQQSTAETYQGFAYNPKSSGTDSVSASVHDDEKQEMAAIEPNGVLTLADALVLTMTGNHELKAYHHEINAARARQLQAGLWPNPELDIEVENFGGTGERSGFDVAVTTIQLSQLIEMGNKSHKRKYVHSYDSKLSELDFRARRQDLSAEMATSFIQLLFMQEKEMLWNDLIQVSTEITDSVEKRVQAGKDSPIDLSKSKIKLANTKLQQLEIVKYKAFYRKRLAAFWGSQTPQFTSVAGRMDQLSDLPLRQSLQVFLQENPELLKQAVNVQKRQAEMSLAQSRSLPNFKIAGGVKYFDGDNDTAFIMGLSVPLAISDRNQGGRAEAMHNIRQAKESQKASYLSVWNRVNKIYADLETAHKRAVILRDEVLNASEQLFNASRIAYEQGKADYLELLDSQKMYFAAKNDYIDALAQYHISRTKLEQLIGRSLQEINTQN
ncbi:MAG: TolC family protein [Planctomycetota bacterium]